MEHLKCIYCGSTEELWRKVDEEDKFKCEACDRCFTRDDVEKEIEAMSEWENFLRNH